MYYHKGDWKDDLLLLDALSESTLGALGALEDNKVSLYEELLSFSVFSAGELNEGVKTGELKYDCFSGKLPGLINNAFDCKLFSYGNRVLNSISSSSKTLIFPRESRRNNR